MKKALEGDDLEAIKSAVEKVGTASQALGAALYANSQAEGDDASQSDDDVIDAEIIDEGDDK